VEAESTTPTVAGLDGFEKEAGALVKRIDRTMRRVGRLSRIPRLAQDANLFDLPRLIRDTWDALESLQQDVDALRRLAESTVVAPDATYESAWATAFEVALRDLGVPVEADSRYPVYHVFPFEVRVDLNGMTVLVNNRVTHVLRPDALARLVMRERERVYGARFPAAQFMRALAGAYDLLRAQGGNTGAVRLRDAYKLLSLREGPSGYPLRQFAFDLYRLRYETDMIYDGRKFVLNPSRSARGAVPVPRPNGAMENLGSYELVEVSSS
jgi:hypothetical protein